MTRRIEMYFHKLLKQLASTPFRRIWMLDWDGIAKVIPDLHEDLLKYE